VQILNVLGAVVYSEEIPLSNGNVSLGSLNYLASGMYVLRITALDFTMKIVKK